jgi:tripartite-type tricarboxylate transporter receptor subunit TctC
LRALAVTGSSRSPAAPELPTIAESGYPGYEAIAWNGIFVPAGTPPDVVNKLNAELKKALDNPEVMQRFEAQGFASSWSSPEAFSKFVNNEVQKWANVAKVSGAKID